MYCRDCENNWTHIEGRRSFRIIAARDDAYDGTELACPQCREPDEDREIRKLGPTKTGVKRMPPERLSTQF